MADNIQQFAIRMAYNIQQAWTHKPTKRLLWPVLQKNATECSVQMLNL
jgi:hypothetical protein